MEEKTKPVHEIRVEEVRAVIWANQSNGGRGWFNTSFSRRYKDGNEWKDSTSFRRCDLPYLEKAAHMAYVWIWQQPKSTAADSANE